jgi:hypothetical protein
MTGPDAAIRRESTLKGLIEGQKQFQVPLYQRQYAWAAPQLSQLRQACPL